MPRHRLPARILVLLASVVAFGAILAVWANRQLLNTDNWTRTSTELLERPVIRDQVATFLVDQLYANVDVAGELASALPPRVQPLAAPAAGALRQLADRAAIDALKRPGVQQRWADANREAHRELLQLLEGGGPNVSAQDGVVVLHLDTVLRELAQRTGLGGRLAANIPPGAADLTILRSDQLAAAQDALRVLRGLPYVLVVLSFALFAAALAVAPEWRRQALRAYGAGFVIAGAAALVTQSMAGDALAGALASTAAVKPAIAAGWSISTTLLVQAAKATIGYGVVMLVGAWLGGPTRPAEAMRRALAPYVRHPVVAYAGLAVLIVLLLWWGPTPATRNPALALVLILLLITGTELFRREIGREHPHAERRGGGLGRAREHVRHATAWVRDPGAPVVQPQAPERSEAQERVSQLERLGRLRESGVLDADEFAAQKREILAGAPPGPNGGQAPATLTPEA
jgi:hypothetical protein